MVFPDSRGTSWLQRFKQRNNIVWQAREHGEADSVDHNTMKKWKEGLKDICIGYNDNDIFNADETGLFYQLEPSGTILNSKAKSA